MLIVQKNLKADNSNLPRFSESLLIFDTSTAELMQLYRMQSNHTTKPIMLVVSKVTLELRSVALVGRAAAVALNVSLRPNMPGLHSFSKHGIR